MKGLQYYQLLNQLLNMNPVIQKMIENNKKLQKQRRYYEKIKCRSHQIYFQNNKKKQHEVNQNKREDIILPTVPTSIKIKPDIRKDRKNYGFLQKFKESQIAKQNLILLNKIQKIYRRNGTSFKIQRNSYSNQKIENYNSRKEFPKLLQEKSGFALKKLSIFDQKHKKLSLEAIKQTPIVQNKFLDIKTSFLQNHKQKCFTTDANKQITTPKAASLCNNRHRRCFTEEINQIPRNQLTGQNYINCLCQKQCNIKCLCQNQANQLLFNYKNQRSSHNYKQAKFQNKDQQCNPKIRQRQTFKKDNGDEYQKQQSIQKRQSLIRSKTAYQKDDNFLLRPNHLSKLKSYNDIIQKQSRNINNKEIILVSKTIHLLQKNFKIDFIRKYKSYQIKLTQQKTDVQQLKIQQHLTQLQTIKEANLIKSKYINYKRYSPSINKTQLAQYKESNIQKINFQKFYNKQTNQTFFIADFNQKQGKKLFQRFDYNYDKMLENIKLSKSGHLTLIHTIIMKG